MNIFFKLILLFHSYAARHKHLISRILNALHLLTLLVPGSCPLVIDISNQISYLYLTREKPPSKKCPPMSLEC